MRDPAKRASLDILIDDLWLNEGFSTSPITAQVTEQLVVEDSLVISIMETKFSVDRETLLKGLRENVWDDVMAIYFLLYNLKLQHGEGSVIKIGDQMRIRNGFSMNALVADNNPVTGASGEITAVDQAVPGSTVNSIIKATSPITRIDEESSDDAQSQPNVPIPPIQLRVHAQNGTPARRRYTVGDDTGVKQLATDLNEQNLLAELEKLQVQPPPPPSVIASAPKPSAADDAPPQHTAHELQAPTRGRRFSISTNHTKNTEIAENRDAEVVVPRQPKPQLVPSSRNRRNTIFSNSAAYPDNPVEVKATGEPADETVATYGSNSSAGSTISADKPRSLRFTFNSKTTSSKQPDQIITEIQQACQLLKISARAISRFIVECISSTPGQEESDAVVVEVEVCKLPRLKNLHGLRFKRVSGSSAFYKILCEKLLATTQL